MEPTEKDREKVQKEVKGLGCLRKLLSNDYPNVSDPSDISPDDLLLFSLTSKTKSVSDKRAAIEKIIDSYLNDCKKKIVDDIINYFELDKKLEDLKNSPLPKVSQKEKFIFKCPINIVSENLCYHYKDSYLTLDEINDKINGNCLKDYKEFKFKERIPTWWSDYPDSTIQFNHFRKENNILEFLVMSYNSNDSKISVYTSENFPDPDKIIRMVFETSEIKFPEN